MITESVHTERRSVGIPCVPPLHSVGDRSIRRLAAFCRHGRRHVFLCRL